MGLPTIREWPTPAFSGRCGGVRAARACGELSPTVQRQEAEIAAWRHPRPGSCPPRGKRPVCPSVPSRSSIEAPVRLTGIWLTPTPSPHRAIQLLCPGAHIARAVALRPGVSGLHDPPAPAAAQQALQQRRSLPWGTAAVSARRPPVHAQPCDVGLVSLPGDEPGMMPARLRVRRVVVFKMSPWSRIWRAQRYGGCRTVLALLVV
jgi:hypothetical protein